MSREVKRVPVDFDWPLRKVWSGYLMPERLHGAACPDCKNGYGPLARQLFDLWYGNLPFHPAITGSVLLTAQTPAVRARAERNVNGSPYFYRGGGEREIVREGQRLADLWNAMWSHHLTQADVDALVSAGRLRDFTHRWDAETVHWVPLDPEPVVTAADVNTWSLSAFGHDGINAHIVIQARCEKAGLPDVCSTCTGSASVEVYPGQRADADAWEHTEPPAGDGWQLWETVSEGSPISPVFADADGLACWMVTDYKPVGGGQHTMESARAFIAAGWAPSMIGSASTGLVAGELAVPS